MERVERKGEEGRRKKQHKSAARLDRETHGLRPHNEESTCTPNKHTPTATAIITATVWEIITRDDGTSF